MKRTPAGTAVGVDDPYAHVERCDHLTDDGRCRFAIERGHTDERFAETLQSHDYTCPVGSGDWAWSTCPHFRSCANGHACRRCGLEEHANAHDPSRRPLLEEHHLAYDDADDETGHEITVTLCRWCHAKVHDAWARVTDDASPDPAAIAERERRRGEEQREGAFHTAAERLDES